MTSELVLINRRPIEIEWNGSYYDTTDLLVLGYWTWAPKVREHTPQRLHSSKIPLTGGANLIKSLFLIVYFAAGTS